MKVFLFLILLTLLSCASNKSNTSRNQIRSNFIRYNEFEPKPITDFKLEEYDVENAFQIDSLIILSAYSEGDLETSEHPVNWGDRLVVLQKNSILFESKPVGDVYLYRPHFYQNDVNGKTIIICQLAYEYYFGGDVFLLENGKIQFLGQIEIDGPDIETSLTDIVLVSERKDVLNFHFEADSLTYKPGVEDSLIQNSNIHYSYKSQKWSFSE